MNVLGFLVFIGFLSFDKIRADLPDYLKKYVCVEAPVPEYTKCLKENFEATRQYFVKGIPELDVPPLDPFELDFFEKKLELLGIVRFSAKIENFVMTGFKGAIIEHILANAQKRGGEITVLFPKIYVESDFDFGIKLLGAPLSIPGHFQGNFENVTVFIKGDVKVVNRNGNRNIEPDHLFYSFDIHDGKLTITGNNPITKILGGVAGNAFNLSPKLSSKLLSPFGMLATRDDVKRRMNLTLSHATADEWLPPK